MLTGIEVGVLDRIPVPFDFDFESVETFSAHLPGLESHDVVCGAVTLTRLQQYIAHHRADIHMSDAVTRAFLIYLLGSTFFSNQKNTIRLGYLAALTDLDALHTFDWGSAILGNLYTALDSYTFGRVRQLYGFWYVLPFWYYEYTANMHSRLEDTTNTQGFIYFPRLRRWSRATHVT